MLDKDGRNWYLFVVQHFVCSVRTRAAFNLQRLGGVILLDLELLIMKVHAGVRMLCSGPGADPGYYY